LCWLGGSVVLSAQDAPEGEASGEGAAATAEAEAQGPMTLSVRLLDEPVVVQPTGGSFDYVLQVENHTGERRAWWIWIEIASEEAGISVLRGPVEMVVHPGRTGVRASSQGVPMSAPGGSYTVTVSLGDTFMKPLTSTSFSFEKLGPAMLWEPSIED